MLGTHKIVTGMVSGIGKYVCFGIGSTREAKKVHCARKHFRIISGDTVKYEVVDSYDTLLNVVMK